MSAQNLTTLSPFVEPTRLIPLRWGSYRVRLVTGVVAIVVGVASVLFTSTYTLPFLAVGITLQCAGWIVLPATGWRRLVVVMPCVLVSCMMLAGADFAIFTSLFLFAWLLVRQRPALSWLTLILPLGVGFICSQSFDSYEQNWAVFALSGSSAIAGAWCAVALARTLPARSAKLNP